MSVYNVSLCRLNLLGNKICISRLHISLGLLTHASDHLFAESYITSTGYLAGDSRPSEGDVHSSRRYNEQWIARGRPDYSSPILPLQD